MIQERPHERPSALHLLSGRPRARPEVVRRRLAMIAARRRTPAGDARAGWLLAAIAGNVDAAGFVIAQRYTSHVTGLLASTGDDLARHAPCRALASASAIVVFVLGAASCTLCIRFARVRRLHALFAWPLVGECLLLVAAALARSPALTATVLCFAMGWQNAFATKVSSDELRTTHVTGIVTDIGIGIGRLLATTRAGVDAEHSRNQARLRLLVGLLMAFLCGAVAGTYLAVRAGQACLLLPAAVIAVAAALPLRTEARAWLKRWRVQRRSRAL
jgi:uncharacterized membrane protein YoaK (UPF0700 family)